MWLACTYVRESGSPAAGDEAQIWTSVPIRQPGHHTLLRGGEQCGFWSAAARLRFGMAAVAGSHPRGAPTFACRVKSGVEPPHSKPGICYCAFGALVVGFGAFDTARGATSELRLQSVPTHTRCNQVCERITP
jgi:hypothetical protein